MKKDKNRFTIRFCEVSPKQITAADVLIAAGRRKAALIADLVDEHIKKYGADAFANYIPGPIIHTAANFEVQPSAALVTTVIDEVSKDSSANKSLDDEACDSILEGLSMFKM